MLVFTVADVTKAVRLYRGLVHGCDQQEKAPGSTDLCQSNHARQKEKLPPSQTGRGMTFASVCKIEWPLEHGNFMQNPKTLAVIGGSV